MRKPALLTTLVLALTAILGPSCQTQHHTPSCTLANNQPSLSDEEAFNAIRKYYQDTFPSMTFDEGTFLHEADGPIGQPRLHVAVPVAVDRQYQHSFSAAFLSRQARSPDGLTRCIAEDLLLLKHTRLFSYPSRRGYNEITVNCTTYVVEAKK
jgi:hypothetical protein